MLYGCTNIQYPPFPRSDVKDAVNMLSLPLLSHFSNRANGCPLDDGRMHTWSGRRIYRRMKAVLGIHDFQNRSEASGTMLAWAAWLRVVGSLMTLNVSVCQFQGRS